MATTYERRAPRFVQDDGETPFLAPQRGQSAVQPEHLVTKAQLDAHVNDATAAHAASAISNTPAGTIAATDVQTAINELDTEKAPSDAQYLTGAAHAGLSAERVVTDTATVAWDLATAAQAKANVPDDSITYAKLQNISAASRLLGLGSDAGPGDAQEITPLVPLMMSGTNLGVADFVPCDEFSDGTPGGVPGPTTEHVGKILRADAVGGWAQVGQAGIEPNAVTNIELNDMPAYSAKVRASGTTGDPSDAAATDHQVLRRSGTALGFGAVALNQSAAVTGTLALGNGGTGQTTAAASHDALTIHGADVASASTINLTTATGYLVDVTGTTTITAITLAEGLIRVVRFTGALTLTHGASLVLPGSANIATVAGDCAIFVGYAAGVVRCVSYSPITVTGTGSAVRATSPTFVTPALGTPSSGTLTNCTGPWLTNALADVKGDLAAASAADTWARLAAGTNGQRLQCDSAQSTGMKHSWQVDEISLFTGKVSEVATFVDLPAAETLLSHSMNRRRDLTNYSQIRLHVMLASGGSAGSKLLLKYSTTFTGGTGTAIGTSEVSCAIDGALGSYSSSWIDLAAGAKADVWVLVTGSGGNGVADPQVYSIIAEIR